MEHPTTFPPTYDHGRDHGACIKGRSRADPLLTPRGSAGLRPYHWDNPVHLTETGPFRTYLPAKLNCPHTTHFLGPYLDRGRRVGRPEPDPATQNSSVFFYCPPGLDNPGSSI